jgi:hypothetical protein
MFHVLFRIMNNLQDLLFMNSLYKSRFVTVGEKQQLIVCIRYYQNYLLLRL